LPGFVMDTLLYAAIIWLLMWSRKASPLYSHQAKPVWRVRYDLHSQQVSSP